MVIVYIGTGYINVLYLGRAPRTKETLPDFHEWRRVTRHPLVFRGLTGSQRTPRIWAVTGGDSMVRTTLAIGRGVDDTRSIRDMGASTKRKENQSSSNSGRKRKTSIPRRLQGPRGVFTKSHHKLSQLISR